jgi:hypothetical protein
MPAGTHAIYLRFTAGDTEGVSKTILTVLDQDIDGVLIPAPEKVRIAGTVLIDAPSREVMDDIRVRAIARDYFYQAASAGPARETGRFAFESLTEGVSYGLSVLGLPDDAYVQDIRRRNLSIFNDGSFVASAGLPDLEVEIRMVGATVRGVVRDAANQPVNRATVVLVPDSQRRANGLLYKRVTTDAEGNFTIKGVAPGEYQTFSWRVGPPIGAEQNQDFMAPYAGRGTTIRAAQGVVSETQLRVIEPR